MAPSTLAASARDPRTLFHLLRRLCVGPDGADKRNEWTIDRRSLSAGIKSDEAGQRVITIAFAGSRRSIAVSA